LADLSVSQAVNTALWWWAKARGRHRKLRPDLRD